jgi:stearoyl-CoA desaturase (delta-9 desaturase)
MTLGVITLRDGDQIPVAKTIPMVAVHLACFAAFFMKFHWSYLIVCLALYWGRMFFVTGGYHRYFSHRSYKTSRVFQFIIALIATSSTQKGVLWWAANHRHHHRYSDTEEDLHSPSFGGFLWSHIGWILSNRYDDTRYELIGDFAKFPELRWLNKYFLVPPVALGVLMFLIGSWPLLIWGYCISTVLLWHSSFTINSLTHLFGKRRYQTTDSSRNSAILALVTMGEGWHNNHHHYMASTRQGFFWWEVDLTYYGLKMLSWFHIVWDLREPPAHVLQPATATATANAAAAAAEPAVVADYGD